MRNAFFFFFFFFFFLRGAKVNFQVNIHIIIQMVDEFVPSYVPFPMQLLLQSIYLLNICAFMHILHVHTPGGTDLERGLGMCGPEDPLFTPLLPLARVPFQAKESVHKTPF